MNVGSIDLNKLRGLGDKAIGLAKELLGTVLGNDRLQNEGQAQQERATAELKALRAELTAEKEDTKAEVLEARQKAAQRAKAS